MPTYDVTTTPVVGGATKRSEYVRLRDSIKAVRQMEWDLGGSLAAMIEDAADTYVDLPDGWLKEINGDDLSGLSVFVEIVAVAEANTAVTITAQLYNVTDAAAVASSTAVVTNPSTTVTRAVSAAVTLAAGNKVYKAQIKRSNTNVRVAARARVYAR